MKKGVRKQCWSSKKRRRPNRVSKSDNVNLNVKVVLEQSGYIEDLIRSQLLETQKSDINNTEEGAEKIIEVNSTSVVNNLDLPDKCKDSDSHKMNVKNHEVFPLHVPTIQITVCSDKKTTRIITKKPSVPKKSWKRNSTEWMKDLLWVTSQSNIFSSAVLGKEDSLGLSLCNSPNTPKRSRPSSPLLIKLSDKDGLSTSAIKSCTTGIISPKKNSNNCDVLTKTCRSIRFGSPEKSNSVRSINVNDNQLPASIEGEPSNLSPIQVVEKGDKMISSSFTDTNAPKEGTLHQHSSKHSSIHFKVPFLPKRPPTRVKPGWIGNKKITDLRKVLEQKAQQRSESCDTISIEDDDAISLYAESLIFETNQPTRPLDRTNIAAVEQDTSLESNTCGQHSTAQHSNTQEVIEQQCEKFSPEKENRTETQIILSENPKVNDWVVNTEKFRCSAIDTEKFLSGYCFAFLKKGFCFKQKHCWFKHEMPSLASNFNDLPETEFYKIVKRCVSFHHLFCCWFDQMLNYMSEHGRRDWVLHLVCDIMNVKCDKMPYIKKIISALKNMGFNFEEAVNEILLTAGRLNECLLDILLSFAVDEENCVQTSWNLIHNLTNFRKQGLDFGVVQDIFQKCIDCDPPDKNLCDNIYKDIIVKNNFDLNKISRTILIKYIFLLVHFKFDSYASYIMTNYKIGKEEIVHFVTPAQSTSSVSFSNSSTSSETSSSPPRDIEFEDIDLESNQAPKEGNVIVSAEDKITEEMEEREIEESSCSLCDNSHLTNQNVGYSMTEVASYLDNIGNYDSGNSSQQYSTFSSSVNCGGCCTEPPAPYLPNNWTISPPPSSVHEVVHTSPEKVEAQEISNKDLKMLVKALETLDWANLLTIMQRYSGVKKTARDLVVHILVAIKRYPIDALCDLVTKMFHVFGDCCRSEYRIMNVLKLLGFNLVPLLDREKKYETVGIILNLFAKDFHSFVEYEYLGKSHINNKDMKYVLLFKILSKCDRHKEALRLLKSSESNLLNPFLNNSYHEEDNKEHKRYVLTKYIESILESNLWDAKDLIIYLMLNVNIERFPELKMYINILISNMLKQYSVYKLDIVNMLDNVLNCWYKYMKFSVLRVLLVSLYNDISSKKVLELFHLCIDIGVYPSHEGTENSISIPSNLLSEEIYLIISYHFSKICCSQFSVSSILINVEEPLPSDEYSKVHSVLINSNAPSTEDMVRRVLNVLTRIKNFPNVETLDISGETIVLPYDHPFLQPYKMKGQSFSHLKLR